MTTWTTKGDMKFFYETTTAGSIGRLGPAVVRVEGSDLLRDPALETSVLISLFSNARAANSDKLPQSYTSREGYFGSLLEGIQIGSKRWLLDRSVIDAQTLELAQQSDIDALQWMVDDGIAESIESTAVRGGQYQVNQLTRINRKDADNVFLRYYTNWQYQIFGGLQ